MKNYQNVVNDRFDQEEDNDNSIYSKNHPIGKYSRKILFNVLHHFLLHYKKENRALSGMKLMDVGCGSGGMIEYFISQGFSKNNVTGIDLSKTRILKAQNQFPEVNFIVGDVITFSLDNNKYELITTFDLFSHLSTKEQIVNGLVNIRKHLANDGILLWYDIYSKDHFTPIENADSWGFSKSQMIDFSIEAGFKIINYTPLFKHFFNRYQSIYQAKRFSPAILRLLEIVLPGIPGNHLVVLEKNNQIN